MARRVRTFLIESHVAEELAATDIEFLALKSHDHIQAIYVFSIAISSVARNRRITYSSRLLQWDMKHQMLLRSKSHFHVFHSVLMLGLYWNDKKLELKLHDLYKIHSSVILGSLFKNLQLFSFLMIFLPTTLRSRERTKFV